MIAVWRYLMVGPSPRANCTICVPFGKAASAYQAECPQIYRRQLDDIIKDIQNSSLLKSKTDIE
jgi:hypothetical protein